MTAVAAAQTSSKSLQSEAIKAMSDVQGKARGEGYRGWMATGSDVMEEGEEGKQSYESSSGYLSSVPVVGKYTGKQTKKQTKRLIG